MLNKSLATIFLLVGFVAPSRVKAESIIYNVNITFGSDSITGTITTDGTTGTITSDGDITAWSLTLDDGNPFDTFTLTEGNSTQYVSGSDLSATPSQLLFDFSDSAGGSIFFRLRITPSMGLTLASPAITSLAMALTQFFLIRLPVPTHPATPMWR